MPLNKNFLTGFILFMPNLFARLNIILQNIKHQVGSDLSMDSPLQCAAWFFNLGGHPKTMLTKGGS